MIFKFGSFNLKNLSRGIMTKRDFSMIATIIRKEEFDIVAFQEILSEGQALDSLVKNFLPGWDIRWGEPKEAIDPSKNKDKRGEGYAFIWNTKRLTLASSSTVSGERVYEPRSVSDAIRFDSRFFARTPYYARFVPVNGGFFEFRLIDVHLHFGNNNKDEIQKRKEEFAYLTERIYPTISQERRYGNNREAYTIVMGDYNLNLYKYRREAEKRINKNTYIEPIVTVGVQQIVTVQDELTTLKTTIRDEQTDDDNPKRGYAQNYDHFSFDVTRFEREGILYKARRIDAVRKYCKDDFELYNATVSDHVPIALTVIMNETAARTAEDKDGGSNDD